MRLVFNFIFAIAMLTAALPILRVSDKYPNKGEREFTPPNPGEMIDWVLVLDDAARSCPPPGTRQ